MFKSKYIKILIIFISINNNIFLTSKTPSKCLFQNKAYPFEYLYSSNESVDQRIITNNTNVFNYFNRRNVYTYPLTFMDDLKMISWELKPIDKNSTMSVSSLLKQQFYLRNIHFDEYLCASKKHLDKHDKRRRLIYTLKLNMNKISVSNINQCVWQFDKAVDSDKDKSFIIWNMLFKEPLYAVSYFYKVHEIKRNVFLWYAKPDSNQFKWHIICL